MTDNVRKIFDMLGVEPNEEFIIKIGNEKIYRINENLSISFKSDKDWVYSDYMNIALLLNDSYKIIKLPKTKKLRDLTPEEWDKWREKNCPNAPCTKCIFNKVYCFKNNITCWVHNKDLYSDKFLDQEIEVDE